MARDSVLEGGSIDCTQGGRESVVIINHKEPSNVSDKNSLHI
jgi:hypothetical protein